MNTDAVESPAPIRASRVQVEMLDRTFVRSRHSLVAFIAAHNEEDKIGTALASLANQTRLPDRIVVVADRCTDRTVDIAKAAGAAVFETTRNEYRKAGAYNQALAAILPSLDATDMVLLMDADTALSPMFLAAAELRLQTAEDGRPPVGSVGAVFLAEKPISTVIHALQRNEYLRYAHDLSRRHGRAEVISGTAGLFPVAVLRHVAAERGRALPAVGYVYDNTALTEDNELTLAIKSLGYRCASPTECTVLTELMPTVKTLYFQRVRWQRGALENLGTYGVTKTTTPYIIRQFLIHIGIAFLPFYVAVLAITIHQTGKFPWLWLWFFISLILVVERVWTVRAGGRGAIGLAALVLPEILYDMFIHVVFIRAMLDTITAARAHWDHREALEHQSSSAFRRLWRVLVQAVLPILTVVVTSVLALLCVQAGIQWIVVGIVVGAGIAHSALRTTMLDPLVGVFGSCENPQGIDYTLLVQVRTRLHQHSREVASARQRWESNPPLRVASALAQRLGRAPTASELASELGLSRDELVATLVVDSVHHARAADRPCSQERGHSTAALSDQGATQAGSARPRPTTISDREVIILAQTLPDPEQTILAARLVDRLTHTQIAARIGMSPLEVSYALGRALADLHDEWP